MKAVVLLLLAFATCVVCSHEELKKCLAARCPDQYNKCLATSGCEAKMDKCADKCGTGVNKVCWATCIGLPGAAANLATCAANQGCVATPFEQIVENIIDLAQQLIRE